MMVVVVGRRDENEFRKSGEQQQTLYQAKIINGGRAEGVINQVIHKTKQKGT